MSDQQQSRSGNGVLAALSNDLASAVERASAATVRVDARRRFPASGIVWSSDGLIVTANHIVERDDDINIGLADGRTLPAKLVGRDPNSDLALLQVDANDLTPLPRAAQEAKVGNLALAVARPGPSGPMASFGVVSTVGGNWRRRGGGFGLEGFIRADVAMLPGFSGGPLVNPAGELIGLNTSFFGRGGGITIRAAAIDKTVESLKTHGKVRRGFLGIGAQAVRLPAAQVSSLGLSEDRGLLIVSVEGGGPAEQAGLMLGDVLINVAGQPVTEVEELQERLSGDLVGTPTPLRILRGGQLQDVTITVGERG